MFYTIDNETFYKIGITNKSPESRATQIHCSSKVIWSEPFLFGIYALKKEQKIIKKYQKYLTKGRFIDISSGQTEIFVKDVLKKDCH